MLIEKTLLPNCYLPSIAWFAVMLNAENVLLEKHENFVKSTQRNRAEIAGTNGALKISVPVEGGKSHRQLFKDVRICYAANWQKIHWQTLCSCYRRSAYFEYYEEKLAPFYHQKFEFLFDFNFQLFETICSMLKVSHKVNFTESYERTHAELFDFRANFKDASSQNFSPFGFTPPVYFQCFESNHGFLPNLCVLDVLFSLGPEAKNKIVGSLHHQNQN